MKDRIMWFLVGVAILAVGLSDPLTWGYIKDNLFLLLVVALLLVSTGAISFLCGYHKGKLIGHSRGFNIGMRWK